jgi:hypothetical protein
MATLLVFCWTNTRVTLQTPMPPSTTIASPTRLRSFSASVRLRLSWSSTPRHERTETVSLRKAARSRLTVRPSADSSTRRNI